MFIKSLNGDVIFLLWIFNWVLQILITKLWSCHHNCNNNLYKVANFKRIIYYPPWVSLVIMSLISKQKQIHVMVLYYTKTISFLLIQTLVIWICLDYIIYGYCVHLMVDILHIRFTIIRKNLSCYLFSFYKFGTSIIIIIVIYILFC